MNRDEEIIKIRLTIRQLEIDSENELLLDRSEAFKYGKLILEDYLKYLIIRLSDTSYTSAKQSL